PLYQSMQGSQGTMGIVTWASMRCELLPALEEPFVVCSSNLNSLMDMAAWLVRLRIANECLILNNTNLAALFAKQWPQDFLNLKSVLPEWTLFYTLAGYEFYPEERISSYIKSINSMTQRLCVEPVKSAGGISANEIMKKVRNPSEEPYWKMRYKGSFQDILFLTIND
ncbi:MAG: hypothetical protein NUV31_04185, partial [Dehalococcoidales bacterium]|nr:hypothetical protein [Dehalococcoidales bacterium]